MLKKLKRNSENIFFGKLFFIKNIIKKDSTKKQSLGMDFDNHLDTMSKDSPEELKQRKYIFLQTHMSNNYFHFIWQNLFPLYCLMKEKKLLNKNPFIVCDKEGRFDNFFKLLTLKKISYAQIHQSKENYFLYCKNSKYHTYDSHNLPERTEEFKKYILSRLNITCDVTKQKHITLIKRKGTRSLVNHKALFNRLTKEFGYCKEVELEKLSLKEQIQLMQKTSLLITPHGASLTNLLFLPRNSAAIEINPHGFKIDLYPKLASIAGIFFLSLEGKFSKSFYSKPRTEIIKEQQRKVGILTSENLYFKKDYHLRRYVRDQKIQIDINEVIENSLTFLKRSV